MRLRLLFIFGFSLFYFLPSLQAQDRQNYDRMIDSVIQIIDTTQTDSTKYKAINNWALYGREKAAGMKEWVATVSAEQLQALDSAAAYFRNIKDTVNLLRSLAHIATYNIQVEDSIENHVLLDYNRIRGYYGYNIRNSHLRPDSTGEYLYYTIRSEFLVLEDSSKEMDFDAVRQAMSEGKFSGTPTNPYVFKKSPKGRVFWLRVRCRSTNFRDDDYHFEIGDDATSWRKIDIYIEDSLSNFSHFKSGSDLDPEEKMIRDWRNKFKVYVPKKGERVVYLRLENPARVQTPLRLIIAQINPRKIMEEEMRTWQVNGVFFGIVLIQAIFFIFLFFSTRIRYYLYYIIFLIGLALIMVVTNYMTFIFPAWLEFMFISNTILSVIVAQGLLYFAFYFLEINKLSPHWKTFTRLLSLALIISASFFLYKLATSSEYYYAGGTENPVENNISFTLGFGIIQLICMVYWGVKAHLTGHKTAKYLLIGLAVMLFGIGFPLLSPILKTNWVSFDNAILSSQVSIIALLAFFGLAIGQQRRELEEEKRAALEEKLDLQEKINAASAKFVPFDFIRSLGKENILDVQLGDATEKEVTVFFSDIRNYTTMVEELSPEENFRFINDFHRTIGPSITEHKGFVNQYLGDGIMAIFLQSQDHALQAAIDIQTRIRTYKPLLPGENGNLIRMGMGLHAGSLMMGIIGDDKRTDAATVSDTVNTASRMEGLTKYYGASILLSGEVKTKLSEEDSYALRYLGKVQVKGKQNLVEVFECLNGRKPEEGEKLMESLAEFQEAVNSYFAKDFKAAIDLFESVLSKNPQDTASRIYLEKAQQNLQSGIADDWDGVLTMKEK
ncbi:MAG: adenylate/guanylate cyclase domain-containing protein [Bacteroidia bacterium]|nr:adenylate/guanylate cyclase domain-containing protein [Bacteroidia bacterium]